MTVSAATVRERDRKIEQVNEEQQKLSRAYKRAGIGLAAAALLWTAAIVIDGRLEESNARWLIPIGAATLSMYCFSLYSKSKES